MKVLVTGASGFIGRNVVEYFQNKNSEFTLYFPTSYELNCINEIEVTNYLQLNKFDIVLHFAVYGDGIDKSKDSSKIMEYNLRIFLNFAKNNHLYGKMLYTGSGAEYDKRSPIENVTENELGKTIPIDHYGLMKYTINQMIENTSNIYNLRLFGIFGQYEYWQTKFISNICCKTIKNLPLSIRQNVYFDYLWIEDFCEILEGCMKQDLKNHSYNITSGNSIDLLSICEIVLKVSGKKLPIYICKEGLANEYTASNKQIVQELNGVAITPVEEAIRKLYNWYLKRESNIEIYDMFY